MDLKEGFAAEIRSNPHDDVPRLVYADYLEESGDPQGELIRIQCELAGTPVTGRSRAELQRREIELLEQYGETWLEPLRDLGAEGIDVRCFRRGLIERVRIPSERFVRVAAELAEAEPALHCIDLRGSTEVIDDLAACAIPPQIVELEFPSNRLEAEHVRGLADAAWRSHVRVLNLGFNRLADDGVAALVEQEWPALERLSLDSNRIGAEGARTLAKWSTLAHLEVLTLNLNPLENGIGGLVRSPHLGSLRRLELASTGLREAAGSGIATAEWFSTIEELVLRNNRLGEEGLLALARSPKSDVLRLLDVRNTVATRLAYYEARPPFPKELRERFGAALLADFSGDDGADRGAEAGA